jgi:hypothetical protein
MYSVNSKKFICCIILCYLLLYDCCKQHSHQLSCESFWVITGKVVCIAADNNYPSEEQCNVELMHIIEMIQCLCDCFVSDYSTQDTTEKHEQRCSFQLIKQSKYTHGHLTSFLRFRIFTLCCIKWPLHAPTFSQNMRCSELFDVNIKAIQPWT